MSSAEHTPQRWQVTAGDVRAARFRVLRDRDRIQQTPPHIERVAALRIPDDAPTRSVPGLVDMAEHHAAAKELQDQLAATQRRFDAGGVSEEKLHEEVTTAWRRFRTRTGGSSDRDPIPGQRGEVMAADVLVGELLGLAETSWGMLRATDYSSDLGSETVFDSSTGDR